MYEMKEMNCRLIL